MFHSQRPTSIMFLGGPGEGKSQLCDYLSAGATSWASDSTNTGATQDVQFAKFFPFGDVRLGEVLAIDTPGLMDPSIPVENIISSVQSKLTDKEIDCVVIVSSCANPRLKPAEMMAMEVANQMISGLHPKNLFLFLTQSNSIQPASWERFAMGKMAALNQVQGNAKIPSRNVVFSDIKDPDNMNRMIGFFHTLSVAEPSQARVAQDVSAVGANIMRAMCSDTYFATIMMNAAMEREKIMIEREAVESHRRQVAMEAEMLRREMEHLRKAYQSRRTCVLS